MAQPFLHELVSCVCAPSVALSGPDGQIRAGGVQGVIRHDRRILSELVVDVDGHEPAPVGHSLAGAGLARFTGVIRHLGDDGADPTVRLDRQRRLRPDGIDEVLTLANNARVPVDATVRVTAAVDLAPMNVVRRGDTPALRSPSEVRDDAVVWSDSMGEVTLRTEGGETAHAGVAPVGDVRPVWSWRVTVPARSTWSVTYSLTATEDALPANTFGPGTPGWEPLSVSGPAALTRLVDQSVADLAGLALADPEAPGDAFLAAGSPWFFTLFGRDSLWAARLTLPLGTDLARGTLRTLARRQGTRHDVDTAEAPGKILHEVRMEQASVGSLPPVYFGTVDATPLWICLLHDAWRWGLDDGAVTDLLDPLEAALGWLRTDADADGDGFCEYVDESGHGLANQGWKDSGDSIQFPDGTIAEPSIALCEAQAYAYEAAIAGAHLLEAFGRPGGDRMREWATALRERFRTTFWVSDPRGTFPALALDGAKRPVATATSNLGHLLGTGILDAGEAASVAARMRTDDLDCGYGLRTMTADVAGFNPLGYHAGTVWPHDTAIAILGLARDGHARAAASLAAGLVRAAPDFAYRLPELFAGTNARRDEPVLAYPAACRPQAWSAAAAIAMLQAALGLEADVPRGVLRVAPSAEFADWFPLRVEGLRVAGHALTVEVDAAGTARVETSAPLTVETPRPPGRE
ncbi:glycogen debranching N-terminal domain-containing protein [Actinopolymorpha sp. B17G11]|uniref:amylo-alpha-1,6-glucosidase n=1 Tax=Actinopolymorpha sp. B17G11 TaxID=3160861 RepID=UPI0032E3D919